MIGSIAVGVALLSALATFLVLSGLTPLPPTHNVVVSLLGINALAALVLIADHRAARSGTSCKPAAAAAPALDCMCASWACSRSSRRCRPSSSPIVATITLDRGLDRFFSVRTKAIIENSLLVSRSLSAASTRR